MSRLIDLVARATAHGDPALLAGAIPYARFMGIDVEGSGEPRPGGEATAPARLRAVMRYSERLIGNPRGPHLHGGSVGALLESAAVFELLWSVEMTELPKIVNVTIHYLRPGQPVDTYAQSTIVRRGRRVVTVHSEAWQDDASKPIAVAHAQFLVAQPDAAPSPPGSGQAPL